ncbi:MAG TPA: hypothetical protein VGD17_01085 [Chitinophagaceae bacterium]
MRNLISLLTVVIVFAGCKKNNRTPIQDKFIDYGYVSAVSSVAVVSTALMVYHQGEIFVASNDGVWKIGLTEKIWRRAGLAGKKVNVLYSHPEIAGKFFAAIESGGPTEKSLYISADAGVTWQAAASPVFDSRNNIYESFSDIRARPGHPNQIFANLSGITISVSKDGGETWNRQNYNTDSYFGINCVINFREGSAGEIYQGAEAPLDHAWLGKYSIDATDPVKLGTLDQFIGKNYEWENRRPNCLETFRSNPGVLYAGLEGALIKIEGTQWKYIFKSTGTDILPYAYITGVWLNPSNKKHIIFGGGVNGTNTSLSLFETYDEGVTITHINDKLGMTDPAVIDIIATENYPAILVRDNGNERRMRLLLYKYN